MKRFQNATETQLSHAFFLFFEFRFFISNCYVRLLRSNTNSYIYAVTQCHILNCSRFPWSLGCGVTCSTNQNKYAFFPTKQKQPQLIIARHVFPRLAPVYIDVFPRLAPVTCFPALDTRWMFSLRTVIGSLLLAVVVIGQYSLFGLFYDSHNKTTLFSF